MATFLNRAPGVLASVAALVAMCGASIAHGALITWTTSLSGAAEAPPNSSAGTGLVQVDFDTVALTMRVQATFTGLTGNTTACHIHAATALAGTGTAGVATQTPSFSGFPLGVTSGAMDTTFDMTLASSFNASYIAAHGGTPASARTDLFQAFDDGKAYFNVHSSVFGGGEIRGFLARVPAPSSVAVLGLAGLVTSRRRRA